MLRRDFLKGLSRLIALATLPATAMAQTQRHILIQQCPLAGFQHHQGEALWPYLGVGDSLELVREPTNPHDAYAIRIDWNGRQLGYIPRAQNQTTARMIDEGKALLARIGGLKRVPNPWERMEVEVFMLA